MTRTCQDCGRPFEAGRYARYGLCCRWKHQRRRLKYAWTPEKDEVLRRRYDSAPGTPARLAAIWGWPPHVVKKRAAVLGLTRPREWKSWSAEEVAFLEEHAGRRLVGWIAKKLGRSLTSTIIKLKKLQLSRRFREGYTLREVCTAFGVDHHAVDRWLREGKLRGRRRHDEEGVPAERVAWFFRDADLLSFIRNHPLAFDLRRVDPVWFLDLVLGPPGSGTVRERDIA